MNKCLIALNELACLSAARCSLTHCTTTNATQYDIGLNASWEADIWGKLKSAKRVAFAGLLQHEAARKAVQTQLIADIAGNYYKLLALDDQLEILKKTAANRSGDVETMKALKASNVVNGVAVVQSQANYYGAEVAIPGLKKHESFRFPKNH